LFEAVVAAQAELVARWMLVGFVHGVMNTDNMTISGETIDYGPCAFLDAFDPATVFSSIDHGGRYAYGNQPAVAEWDLARLAESLLPLIDDDRDAAVTALGGFRRRYHAAWSDGMRAKLGLTAGGDDLIGELPGLLERQGADYTAFFRTLGGAARGGSEPDLAAEWLARWRVLAPDADLMDRVNPVYIPRNHLVEEALTAATDGDLGPVNQLLEVLADPFTEQPGRERYAAPAPADSGPYRTFCGT
jgi:uncharacterized protein YdiU (UPF0061 family)